MKILETKRLILREMDQNDFNDLAEMLENPRVMKAYEHDFSKDDIQAWLDRQIGRYQHYGFGLWAIILKETGEMIGQAGLTMQEYNDKQVLEIGYMLKEKHWHCGYAKEAALACRDYAFENLNQDKVYSIIKIDNVASIRVAKSIGMHQEDTFMAHYYNGQREHYLYSITRCDEISGK